uniref:Uncharacterized protein n=1 Tax=Oryza sativa subsp. japonica TaxID=39947 RepID=Q5Z784_ORYSJ|nr:hypothetical protein [Oryza sativa Japonica Group]
MSGGDSSPMNFNESVSHTKMQGAIDQTMKRVEDLFAKIDVTNSIERMEKRLPTITDKLDDIDGRLPLLRDGTHKHGEVVKGLAFLAVSMGQHTERRRGVAIAGFRS